jgi:nucleotide-binding universal stress UspA family protein
MEEEQNMSGHKAGNEIKKILVGVDGSEKSHAALKWASELALKIGASLEVMTTWQTPFPTAELVAIGFNLDMSEINDRPQAIAELRIDKVVQAVFGKVNPEGVTKIVTEGYPALMLVEKSKDVDLLVLGNRGYSPAVETLLGSVSQHCLSHAKCPVVIVK